MDEKQVYLEPRFTCDGLISKSRKVIYLILMVSDLYLTSPVYRKDSPVYIKDSPLYIKDKSEQDIL